MDVRLKHTMDNNKMFKFVQTILNGGKVPQKDNRKEKAQASSSASETVAMLNAQKNTQKKQKKELESVKEEETHLKRERKIINFKKIFAITIMDTLKQFY